MKQMVTAKNPELVYGDQAVQVDVQVAKGIPDAPAESDIRRWLEHVVDQLESDATRTVEFSVRIVDEDEGRALNKQYRDIDKATNVLSFPLLDTEMPAELPLVLGDIVICGPVVAREAAEQGKSSSDHWAHMMVHGALHLFGYGHETDEQAQEMEALEARILAQGGIDNPYECRD